MPTTAVNNKGCLTGKWRIGKGECKFNSRSAALAAYEHWIEELAEKAIGEEMKRNGIGRNDGDKPGSGPEGSCVCKSCGYTMLHVTNTPCNKIACPKCGKTMTRK